MFNPYIYNAKIISVYDGDSVTAEVDLGFNIKFEMKIRLALINTPEIRGEEREAGLVSRDALIEKILNKEVVIETDRDKTGKYGRYVATIYMLEPSLNENQDSDTYININKWLVDNKYAEYYGDKTYL
jgi:micrococcal nuclease